MSYIPHGPSVKIEWLKRFFDDADMKEIRRNPKKYTHCALFNLTRAPKYWECTAGTFEEVSTLGGPVYTLAERGVR